MAWRDDDGHSNSTRRTADVSLADRMRKRPMSRSPQDVLQDHLKRRKSKDLEGDLERNYAPDVVQITKDGVFHGREGVRKNAALLNDLLPDPEFSYDVVRSEGEVALLSWSAKASDGATSCDGADTFVIRDGRIVAQTVHYSVRQG